MRPLRPFCVALLLFVALIQAAQPRAGGGQTYSRPATSSYRPPSRPAYTPPRSTPYRPAYTPSRSTPSRPGYTPPRSTSSRPSDRTTQGTGASTPPTAAEAPRPGWTGIVGVFLIILISLVPVIVVVALLMWAARNPQRRQRADDTGVKANDSWLKARQALRALREDDPLFSEPVFVDFVILLYTRLQEARGKRAFEPLRPFVSDEVWVGAGREAAASGLQAVDEVVVGAVTIDRLDGLQPPKAWLRLVLTVSANFTEVAGDQRKRWFVSEQLTFTRRRGVRSKAPEDMRALSCPACGAPSELRPDGTCPYCDRPSGTGEFQWVLAGVKRLEQTDLPKTNVTDVAPEVGTDDADLRPPDYAAGRRAFRERHPTFDEAAFERRVRDCFTRVQMAWSSGRWGDSRAVVSDAVYDRNRYWMDMYRAQGLVNRLEDIVIERVSPVRYDQDAFFDCITVRIHARMRDFFTDAAGNVVGGDAAQPRRFSEYWTFLRRADYDASAVRHDAGCPNCGAPLEVNASGQCAHCQGRINSGRFDWVLTRIEQDEEYEPG